MSDLTPEALEFVKYAISEGALRLADEGISDEDLDYCPFDLSASIQDAAFAISDLEQILQRYRAIVA